MAKRKLRAEKPPIIEQHSEITVTDTVIFQTCRWTSKGNGLDVLSKLLQAGAREHSLSGRRERLQRIANTGATQARAKATATLKQLDHFISTNPTDGEKKAFLSGCSFAESMMEAELVAIEPFALAGKNQQRSAAIATAGRSAKSDELHQRIREGVKKLLDEDPKLNLKGAQRRYFNQTRPGGPRLRTIKAATKGLWLSSA